MVVIKYNKIGLNIQEGFRLLKMTDITDVLKTIIQH